MPLPPASPARTSWRDRVAEIVALAKEEHPYEVPGISTRTITGGKPDYLAWIAEETAPE
jgi:uncharacterized protein involved in tolerance to divalent cations